MDGIGNWRDEFTKNKKGAGASPLFLIDPPKPDPVEVGFRPPREANLYKLRGKRALGVPVREKIKRFMQRIENVRVRRMLHGVARKSRR